MSCKEKVREYFALWHYDFTEINYDLRTLRVESHGSINQSVVEKYRDSTPSEFKRMPSYVSESDANTLQEHANALRCWWNILGIFFVTIHLCFVALVILNIWDREWELAFLYYL